MGYESTFSGSFTPNKPIPQEIADIINKSDAALVVAGSGVYTDTDYEPGDVCPASYSMRAYDFGEDLVKIQRLLNRHGIKLTGSVERKGEDGEDFELFEARNGRLRSCTGRIVYGRGVPLDEACITRYSILALVRPRRPGGGKAAKPVPVGWTSTADDMSLVPLLSVDGVPVLDRPPMDAECLRDRKKANQEARRLRRKDKEHLYRVVPWIAVLEEEERQCAMVPQEGTP